MNRYSQSDKKKIGNAVVYIANRVSNLSKTKLLKLLYFMEEYSTVRFQTPFLGVTYEVWQAGPVVKDIFIDLSETPILLDGYIKKVIINNKTYIKPIVDFSDEEFSDNDMIVMDDIIKRYGDKPAKELVNITHNENSLWYMVAKRNNLIEQFKNKEINNSSYTIDMSELLSGCDKDFYKEQIEFLNIARAYDR